MKLKILIPTEILLESEATKILAEAENGHFCLLPHHVDFVAALVPGILSFTTKAEEKIFVAVDQGILVKCDREVLVSTLNAVEGHNLETLKQTVLKQFQLLEEKEKLTRSAVAQFEASMMRHFKELGHG